MKIAVFSDVHGNCIALDAMLSDLKQRPADRLVCLGDAIQGGPQPVQVVSRLRELGCPVVTGNADAWLVSGEDSGRETVTSERQKKLDAVREWSLSQLSVEDVDFIRQFQPTVMIDAGGGQRVLCFHGSPTSFDDVILPTTPEDEFQKYLGGYAEAVLCGGHTHIQHIRRIRQKIYFNPGSVGFAYMHGQDEGSFRADPWAEYAVLTLEGPGYGLEFRRVPYDAGKLVQVYRESGHPYADQDAERYKGR